MTYLCMNQANISIPAMLATIMRRAIYQLMRAPSEICVWEDATKVHVGKDDARDDIQSENMSKGRAI